MRFLEDHCEFKQLTIKLLSACEEFDCGKDDLNDFFLNASAAYSRDLLGKSYCFTLSSNPFVVVDAYNEERPIRYYQKCGFDFLIPDKTAELKYTRNTVIKDAVDLTEPKEEDAVFLDTRLMFFDLIRLRC